MNELRQDANAIIRSALLAAQPDTAVQKALSQLEIVPGGRLLVIALGKAAWQMARAAHNALGAAITQGLVITKYGHSGGEIQGFTVREAGHPVPDSQSFAATKEALDLARGLSSRDTVLLLISGGGSALFEMPLISADELADITRQLLASGADIREMNTIRKRLSAVKGGRFALACQPARVVSIILSDIIGDPLDMIASGPACPDASTTEDARRIAARYGLRLSEAARALLDRETPKELPHVTSLVTGSVGQLCEAAARTAKDLGYRPCVLTASLACQAREAGRFLGAIAQYHQDSPDSLAFIAGGETVVRLQGNGRGGRNQELALAAALELDGLTGVALFSLGSDGTDGPTDAAGGYVDGQTAARLRQAGIDPIAMLDNNDAYPALQAVDGLVRTGPTGTNVNDISVLLIRGREGVK